LTRPTKITPLIAAIIVITIIITTIINLRNLIKTTEDKTTETIKGTRTKAFTYQKRHQKVITIVVVIIAITIIDSLKQSIFIIIKFNLE
jgi:hypothetical protein